MRDDNQLEVLLLPSGHHDVAQSLCQACAVLCIKVGGRLIQSQDAAIQAEGFSKGQSDDETRQDLQPHSQIGT